MKLQELKSVRAVASCGLSITRAAESLHASQPGISRHVLEVEAALGVELFVRRRNRLVGLTAAGQALLPLIDRALNQLEEIPRVARRYAAGATGSLTIATTHMHARYALPPVIERFIAEFPAVALRLRQGFVNQIAGWVHGGEADLLVCAAPPPEAYPDLRFHPYQKLHRVVLTHAGHPLLKVERPTLRDIAAWPVITYDREFAAYTQILQAFEEAGLKPNIALSTSDTDVMKTYAECGLGVAIVGHLAYDRKIDKSLRAIDARHLFPSVMVQVGVRRASPLSMHALRFIELLSPKIRAEIAPP